MYEVRFQISYIEPNQHQVVDNFLNALRFCRIEESITLEDVVIDRSFVERVNAIEAEYWFDGGGSRTSGTRNF